MASSSSYTDVDINILEMKRKLALLDLELAAKNKALQQAQQGPKQQPKTDLAHGKGKASLVRTETSNGSPNLLMVGILPKNTKEGQTEKSMFLEGARPFPNTLRRKLLKDQKGKPNPFNTDRPSQSVKPRKNLRTKVQISEPTQPKVLLSQKEQDLDLLELKPSVPPALVHGVEAKFHKLNKAYGKTPAQIEHISVHTPILSHTEYSSAEVDVSNWDPEAPIRPSSFENKICPSFFKQVNK
ncbi:hypothetical protein ACLOJK_018877 [Asimina triloba]